MAKSYTAPKVLLIVLLKLDDTIEDVLITLGKAYHIIRPTHKEEGLFLYVVANRSKANLAMARRAVENIEKELTL